MIRLYLFQFSENFLPTVANEDVVLNVIALESYDSLVKLEIEQGDSDPIEKQLTANVDGVTLADSGVCSKICCHPMYERLFNLA